MKLKTLLGFEKPNENVAYSLYGSIVAQARQSYFYKEFEVPDTLEGRYDMIIIHAFLLFHRLKLESADTRQLSQTVFDVMFKDFDQSLREMGVGDMGVGPRIKKMAASFYGRITAYDKAIAANDDSELQEVIARNVYNKSRPNETILDHLGSYMKRNVAHIQSLDTDDLIVGRLSYVHPKEFSQSDE